jgi:hypothetical protein
LTQLRKKRGDRPAFSRPAPGACSTEGLCVQMMHIGPYATEPDTIEKMKVFSSENNLVWQNNHHEIYLGDPRRSDPSKMKTILRHPVEKAT